METSRSQWRALGEPFEEAQVHSNLCNLELKSGNLPAALACNQETFEFFHQNKVATMEAEILNRMGGVYDLQGEPDDALKTYRQVLALWQALGDRKKEAATLNNMAVVYRLLGDWQEALRLYAQAREILKTLDDPKTEASVLNNVGFLYNGTGQPGQALKFLTEALELRKKAEDRAGEITTLNNLGAAWRKLGNLEKALDRHQQALAVAQDQGDDPQKATTLVQMAEVHLEGRDPAAALRDLDAALLALGKRVNRTEMDARHLQGRALAMAGRAEEALPLLQENLRRRRSLRDRMAEAEALHDLALAERSLGHPAKAISDAKEAVNRLEELRTGFVSADLRASFLATRRRSFSLLIDLLMDQDATEPGKDHDREAFAISERARARARSLLDVLRAGTVGHNAGAAPPGLLTQRSSLLRRVSAKVNQRLKQSGKQAEALDNEVADLRAELDLVEAKIRQLDPSFAVSSAPQLVTPQDISGWLEPGTVLLEYSLGEERSFLWAIEPGQVRSFILPSQEKIETLTSRVYTEMSTVEAGSAPRRSAEDLSRILLGPIWSGGSPAAPIHRLIVVPDGALAIVPFAALPVPDPGKTWQAPGSLLPLVERLEVVSLPSATTLAAQRQRPRVQAPKLAAIFADPVFSAGDERLALHVSTHPARPGRSPGKKPDVEAALRGGDTRGLPLTLESLPATRKEAEAVAALAPGQVTLHLGLAATREAALAADLRDYRILHFATHALADTQNPELSGLVLSQVDAGGRPREGFLGLSDIYDLDLDADLVVLSGCRTALGKEVRGEGLMGLTRGFQYAGVPRVVASLWRVQDRATAELMTRFYRAMWHEKLSPAAALREAQRSLRREPRYRNPYLWAGFMLQGDWR